MRPLHPSLTREDAIEDYDDAIRSGLDYVEADVARRISIHCIGRTPFHEGQVLIESGRKVTQMRILDRILGRHHQDTGDDLPEGYCFKCKSRKRLKDPVQLSMKNGRSRIQGFCETCGVEMSKMGKLENPSEVT